jgi:putative transposase
MVPEPFLPPGTIPASPFNVFSEEKIQEKLNYLHNHPVKRGLVSAPGDWPWSSWRFYYLQDASLLRMDRLR